MLNLRKFFISTTVLSSSRNSIFLFYNFPLLIHPHILTRYCSLDFFESFVNGSLQTCISKTVNLRSFFFFFFDKFNAWVSSGIVSFNFFLFPMNGSYFLFFGMFYNFLLRTENSEYCTGGNFGSQILPPPQKLVLLLDEDCSYKFV